MDLRLGTVDCWCRTHRRGAVLYFLSSGSGGGWQGSDHQGAGERGGLSCSRGERNSGSSGRCLSRTCFLSPRFSSWSIAPPRLFLPLCAPIGPDLELTRKGIFPTLLYYLPLDSISLRFADSFNRIFSESREFYPFYFAPSFVRSLSLLTTEPTLVDSKSSREPHRPLFNLPLPLTRRKDSLHDMVLGPDGDRRRRLIAQGSNSLSMTSSPATLLYGPTGVLLLTSLGGATAGATFCNTYWKVMKHPLPLVVYIALDAARSWVGVGAPQEEEAIGLLGAVASTPQERSVNVDMALREFLLSAVAPPDVTSVAIASLVGMCLQWGLCVW